MYSNERASNFLFVTCTSFSAGTLKWIWLIHEDHLKLQTRQIYTYSSLGQHIDPPSSCSGLSWRSMERSRSFVYINRNCKSVKQESEVWLDTYLLLVITDCKFLCSKLVFTVRLLLDSLLFTFGDQSYAACCKYVVQVRILFTFLIWQYHGSSGSCDICTANCSW